MRALGYLTILVFTGLVSISRLSAQTTSEQIKAIRTEFKAINADTTLKKVTLENEEFLGTALEMAAESWNGFFKGKRLRRSICG